MAFRRKMHIITINTISYDDRQAWAKQQTNPAREVTYLNGLPSVCVARRAGWRLILY
jgi:hypothetical protein